MGLVPPDEGFLAELRRLADEHGALLVLDEVISGFRVARGGAQELLRRRRRPDDHGQGDRRRPARRGLRRAPRADARGSLRPATSTRRAPCRATRSRSPPGWRRWRSSTRRLRAPRRAHRAARRGPARGGRRPAGPGRLGPRPRDPVLRADAGARLRRRLRLRPRRLRRASAGRCSTAASTRPRRSSRPGSSRSPTTRRRSSTPARRPPRSFAGAPGDARPPRTRCATSPASLRADDSVISPHVAEPAADRPALGLLAAAGPRTAVAPGEYALVVEAVREGYLLHYGRRDRVVRGADADLALLAGDYLYALGLERLAALGDLERRPRALGPDQPRRPGPRRQHGPAERRAARRRRCGSRARSRSPPGRRSAHERAKAEAARRGRRGPAELWAAAAPRPPRAGLEERA